MWYSKEEEALIETVLDICKYKDKTYMIDIQHHFDESVWGRTLAFFAQFEKYIRENVQDVDNNRTIQFKSKQEWIG